jgi:hypothetical protein
VRPLAESLRKLTPTGVGASARLSGRVSQAGPACGEWYSPRIFAISSGAEATNGQEVSLLPAVAWAVHGKICQQYGLDGCAKSSRAKALSAAEATKDDESTQWLLAMLDR